jgi:glycosyltransferase involved in cell wall biosynthesis
MKIAVICNWRDNCGISTYTKYLVDALVPKVDKVRIFSEFNQVYIPTAGDPEVICCWQRGQSMKHAIELVVEWKPDFVIIQHEYGIFPKATNFLQMLSALEDIPYAVAMHSVYEHLDKSVCSAAAKCIIVHSEEAKKTLRKIGNNSEIFVVPHGCVQFDPIEKQELWNIFQTPHALVQFGFGFFYKGVDRALQAIHLLKNQDNKFKDIFYCYLCSSNIHTNIIHEQYYDFLRGQINQLDLSDNVAIIKKFHTEQTINNYLRTAKVALFPYTNDPKNMVYGASGAIRIAMANGIPVIASDAHLFDDLEGVVPRCANTTTLANEIDKIFSDSSYKNKILESINSYIEKNNWDISADRYLGVYEAIR